MGMSLSTYIGPFALAECNVVKEQKRALNACRRKEGCTGYAYSRPDGENFCPYCKEPLTDFLYTTDKQVSSVSYWDVAEAIEEALFASEQEPGKVAWMPNRYLNIKEIDLDRECIELVDHAAIKLDIDTFTAAFKEELTYLKSQYRKVEVVWGVVNEWR